MLEGGAPNAQRQFISVTIKEEEHCAEERNLLMVGNRQQEAAFEGKVSPEAPMWPLMKWKVYSLCQSSFQSEMSPAQESICYSWGLSLLPLPALMEAVQVTLHCRCNICFSRPFSAEAKAEYIMGLQVPLNASHPLQPPDTVCV